MKHLRMKNEEYHSLIQQLPDIIYKINKNGYFTFLNNSISILGYNPQDLVGKHFSTILHKDYIDRVSRDKVLPKYKKKKTGDLNAPKLFDERIFWIASKDYFEIVFVLDLFPQSPYGFWLNAFQRP